MVWNHTCSLKSKSRATVWWQTKLFPTQFNYHYLYLFAYSRKVCIIWYFLISSLWSLYFSDVRASVFTTLYQKCFLEQIVTEFRIPCRLSGSVFKPVLSLNLLFVVLSHGLKWYRYQRNPGDSSIASKFRLCSHASLCTSLYWLYSHAKNKM